MKHIAGFILTIIFALFMISCDSEKSDWNSAESKATITGYQNFIQKHPGSSHVREALFALGKIYDADREFEAAQNFYRDFFLKNPSDSISLFTADIAALKLKKDSLQSKYDARCKGDLQPVEGVWGLCQPIEGRFSLDGKVECKLAGNPFSARVSDWSYLYEDPEMTKINGWGVVVTGGDVVLPVRDWNKFRQNSLPYYAKNNVDAEPLDYFGKYIRIHIDKNQSLVIPVVLFEDFNRCTTVYQNVMSKAGMGYPAGSVFGISGRANSVKTGLPTTVQLTDKQNTFRFRVSLYKWSNTQKDAGMKVDKYGVKMGFNTRALRFTIIGDSYVNGTMTLHPAGCDKEYAILMGKK